MKKLTPEEIFLNACSQKGLVLDTNLLILLFVGRYKQAFIPNCPRTSNYKLKDYLFLERLLTLTNSNIIVTPHSLAELSNLTFDGMLYGKGLDEYFSHVVELIATAEEKFITKDVMLEHAELLKFGFADVANAEIAKDFGCAVMTEDNGLYGYLSNQKYPVLNLAVGQYFQL